jgi:C4-dicarboxylate-specific signal transduction histidine kinase
MMIPAMAELLEKLMALQEELADQTRLADLGETAGSLAHEFNNYLNTVGLHLLVLESKVSKDLHADLIRLRQQGSQVAALIHLWQESRRRASAARRPVNLNGAVREALEITRLKQEALEEVPVRLELAADLSPVAGSPAGIKRLCTFLLKNAMMSAGLTKGGVVVRTKMIEDHVLLEVEDTGSPIEPELLSHVFETAKVSREGTDCLELLACKRLVQRLQGDIQIQNRSGGGVVVTVELEAFK